MSAAERELAERNDELSPHQRALSTVLRLWTMVAVPGSILLAIVVATIVARTSLTSINALILLLTYFAIGMPTSAVAFLLQERARNAIAVRVLAQLDAPARAAVSGRQSTAGFLGVGDDDRERER